MRKRALSIILTLAMVLTMAQGMSVTVWAAEDPVCKIGDNKYPSIAEALAAPHTDESSSTPTAIQLITDDEENVTISSGRNITLDLNGYILKAKSSGSVITNEGTLTVIDSNTDNQTHNYTVDDNGLWTITDGALTADYNYEDLTTRPAIGDVIAVKGGCITGGTGVNQEKGGGGVYNSGTLTLVNGNIIGNKTEDNDSRQGGGVRNAGVFDMIAGQIIGNYSYRGGGGVFNGGTFTLTGGSISYNTAKESGGGVGNDGTFTMEKGEITFNTAGQGGGGLYNPGTCILFGGKIESNTAGKNAGGVDSSYQITLGGSIDISLNTITGSDSNLGLPLRVSILLGARGSTVIDCNINVDSSLSPNAKIGVTLLDGESKSTIGAISTTGAACVNCFYADDSTKGVIPDGDGLQIVEKKTVTLSDVGANDKEYDGKTIATATATLNGVDNGDNVSLTSSAIFGDKNVGQNKKVNIEFSLEGSYAGKYILEKTTAEALANITAKRLSVSGTTAASKQYDGTTVAAVTIGTVDGIIDGDDVTVSAIAYFADAEVGEDKDVYVSYELSGDDAGNYSAPEGGQTSATITAIKYSPYIAPVKKPVEPTPAKNPFVDVFEKDYYYSAVLWAAEKGITSGVDSAHFAPLDITTRAQMVTFLWRAAGCPEPTSTSTPFTDIKAGSYYEKAVLWGYEMGIIKGTSPTTFSPDDIVTRAQAVAFLWRYDGAEQFGAVRISYTDVLTSDYFFNAVYWADINGITEGTSPTTFSPDDDCQRGQIVTFLWRYFVK